MVNKQVEIVDESNFYDHMRGMVIQEESFAVLVEIRFTLNNVQKVWFYKNQVEEIN